MEEVELTLGVTRRQILETLLVLPAAQAACRRAAPPPVPGELLGASLDLGHRVRTSNLPPPSGDRKHVAVAIVGGGPSGLSAAWRLERLGFHDYLVFDLEPRAGGTSQFGTDGIVPHPWGAHYVPVPSAENVALVALLREMGAIEDVRGGIDGVEEQLVRAPEERLFYRGRWYEGLYLRAGATEQDLTELATFERTIDELVHFRGIDGRRAFGLPLVTSTTDSTILDLDNLPMSAWMARKGFQSERLRWLVDYACRDDYGLRLEDTSAYAGLFYFCSRKAGAGDQDADFLTWPNGNGHIVEHLTRAAEPRIRTRSLVSNIAPRESALHFSVYDSARRVTEAWSADQLIFAAPKFLAPFLLESWRDHAPDWTRELDYGSWMVANIHLRSPPTSRGFPLAWDNVLYESKSLGYVVATHQALRDHGPTIWTYYYPMTESDPREGRKRLLGLSHGEWCHIILADLARAHVDLGPLVDRIDVWRWGHAMARPRVGTMRRRGSFRAPDARVYFAHSDMSSMGLFEEAQNWGVRAAEEVLTARGFPPRERWS